MVAIAHVRHAMLGRKGGFALRIIAGEAGGRRIIAPKGRDTRPTLDRVKESLFSILGMRLSGAMVLDLFAGSGALGLEALSRGAAQCVFVDSGRQAQMAVRQNLAALAMEDRGELLPLPYQTALPRLKARGVPFGLAFLDPPYAMAGASEVAEALFSEGLICRDGLVVFEHDKGIAPVGTSFRLQDLRTYGDTALSFLIPTE